MTAKISILNPVATTVWTTGGPGAISFNCDGTGNTTIPIAINLLSGSQIIPVPGLGSFGQHPCNIIYYLTINTLPATIPSGSFYSIQVITPLMSPISDFFTINNPATTSGTLTATATSTNGTSTTVTAATTSTTSTTGITTFLPIPKSNNAAIGGGIAGAVVAIAAVIALLVLRRRQQGKNQPIDVKESGADTPPDIVLPSIEKTRVGGEFGGYSPSKPSDKDLVANEQVPLTINPQSTPSPLHSWTRSFQNTKPTPFPLSFSSPSLLPSQSVSSLNPEDHVQNIQQQLAFRQEQLASRRSPQYISSGQPNQTFSSLRGPEEADGIALNSSTYELQQQVNLLHTELNQLQAKLDSSL
ncbi:MAG: hypothetical protein JOS17DRAFT_779951 [Linnemannia elongata]|nr:MAG: hypothetical protein JOS17DRAFT_779951 [Linnemannia elongata]